MTLKPAALAFALSAAVALPARAGEVACWVDRGVVVVTATMAGVSGDYILDTGQAASQLAETQAQAAGYAGPTASGDIRLAGLRLRRPAVAIADIDVRTGLMPTPIAGVIGADVLAAYVVDLSFSPCRLTISRPGRAPRLRFSRSLPISRREGRPTVTAAVSDGPTARRGDFVLATGSDTPVRLSDTAAALPGVARLAELYTFGVLQPRLRALSFAGDLTENLPAGLVNTDGPLGEIGAPVLSAYRLRFDFPRGRLLLTPQ